MLKRKLIIFTLLVGLFFSNTGCLTDSLDTSLTSDEIVAGLKEALKVGTNNSVVTLNKTDGYFGATGASPLRILLPDRAAQVESAMRSLGLGSIVDDVILKMNRAAEKAATKAGPIFVDAVTNMTISDGLNILNGNETAATTYLSSNTRTALYSLYKPDIEEAMTSVGAQQAWSQLTSTYNSLPLVTPIDDDLSAHVTNKALDGLFTTIGKEEAKIRKDPVARVSDILKKVFGSKD